MRTVTMLFTDIEGSTRLLARLGDDYVKVLASQRSILRGTFQRWRGREMGTEGDSFFVVFDSVADAVSATYDAQRQLASHAWPGEVDVGVRMGLHTGEPLPHEDGFVGMDVHRAARIAGCAHGGQVVVSEATRGIATHQGLDGLSFLDLGPHRLKDLPGAEHLYQLVADDLPRRFGPLRSLGASSSLPSAPTSLVGRDGELRELGELLTRDDVRLLTLTGAGGSGKTRLAVALAARVESGFSDGVFFVPLESVTSTDAIWTTIAEVLGVTGESRTPPTFLDYLSTRQALLVLDNLEQLTGAAGVVAELVGAAPRLRVLATSRRPLHCAGEHEHPVPPLTLPDRDQSGDVAASGAVQLFVQRARMVRPDFALDEGNEADVADICRALDGLPLAVELAAARVKLLGTRGLRARLDQSLELTSPQTGLPDRQRTLRATIGWSYALLSPAQQQAFRRLGVLSSPFDLAAVAAVVGDGTDPLTHVGDLVDASLAEVGEGPDGEPQVRLLRTVAAYARDQLSTDEQDGARARHAEHYLSVVEIEGTRLRSADYLDARDRIEAALDNLRAAIAWSLAADEPARTPSPEQLGTGLRLCQGLGWFWYACGYQAEGRRWTALAMAAAAAAGQETPALITTLHGLGVLLLQHGEPEQGRDALTSCLAFWRKNGDVAMVARELNSLAVAHRALGDPDAARKLLEQSIAAAREAGDDKRLASALSNLSTVESETGQHDRAIDLLREARDLDARHGDTWALGVDDVNLAALLLRGGRVDEAHDQLLGHAAGAVALGDPDLTADVLALFCSVFAARGDAERAATMLGAVESMRRQAELPMSPPDALALEAAVDTVRGLPSPGAWDANVENGSTWGVEAALQLALQVTSVPVEGAARTPMHGR